MTKEDKIRKADDVFLEILRGIQEFRFINPLNHAEARLKYLESWRSKHPEHPVFEYDALPLHLEKWKKLLRTLGFGESALEQAYDILKDELCLHIELLQSRGSEEFTEISERLYGRPSPDLIGDSWEILKRTRKPRPSLPDVGVRGLMEKIREKIREDRIESWDVVQDHNIVSLAQIDSSKKKVRLRAGLLVNRPMMERVIAHHILTHVYRAANGERQRYKAFAYGFDQYLETEEGMALSLEEDMNLLQPILFRKYAARVIASSKARSETFHEIFHLLVEHFTPDDAFTLTLRSKRGIEKSNGPGGYVRDHIYLRGQRAVQSLSRADRKILYVGRISIHHLPMTRELLKEKKIFDPVFLPPSLQF